ncbi:MAG: molybdopterin molybdotransferase MoeA [Myxococcales bacterium]|nr:molybdopterin molybdotransferase MoeA [Myxococcales bacterium]
MALSFGFALKTVLSSSNPLEPETVDIAGALGRVLACPVTAIRDDPYFDRSAMDGYALRSGDIDADGSNLNVVCSIFAGDPLPQFELVKGEAARIMTGAPVPNGADAVQIVENTISKPGSKTVQILRPVSPGANIRKRGEIARVDDVIVEAGSVVDEERSAVIVSAGYTHVNVFRRPSVRVLATGDELVEPGVPLASGQLYESNRTLIAALCKQAGAIVSVGNIVPDDPRALAEAIEASIDFDVLVLSGGVSVGDKDMVAGVLENQGVTIQFHGVSIQPGKPLLFGKRGQGIVFGLPGNPVSAAVTAKLFLVPALLRLQGIEDPLPPVLRMPVRASLHPGGQRLFLAPAAVECVNGHFEVAKISTQGSADAVHHARRNAFLVRPANAPAANSGDGVSVIMDSLRTGGNIADYLDF